MDSCTCSPVEASESGRQWTRTTSGWGFRSSGLGWPTVKIRVMMARARGVKVPVVSSESDSDAHPHHHYRQWHPGHLSDWITICLKAAIHPELPLALALALAPNPAKASQAMC
jgi:hypothetical protein